MPNVGKSTLFNAVSRAGAQAANFPFTTIEPNVGIVPVPDARLERIAGIIGSPSATPTTMEFVDIAGLVEGASRGEGLGNQFLAAIREVDAVCHVLRCFDDPDVVHLAGGVDPVRDLEIIETELVLRDLESVDKRRDRMMRLARAGETGAQDDAAVLQRLHDHLDGGRPARTFSPQDAIDRVMGDAALLTAKPEVLVANVSEDDLSGGGSEVRELEAAAVERHAEVVIICAELEAELAALPPSEQEDYLAAVGLENAGMERLVRACYRLLGLVTFFTANENEARAWTVAKDTPVREAVGQVHTDMSRGFIRAEVISFDDLDTHGSEAAVREAGRLRTEGRDYRVRDGDLIQVRFSV
jgi:ribosome-binding ATPase